MFLSFFQFYVKWRCKGTRTSFRKQFIGTTDSFLQFLDDDLESRIGDGGGRSGRRSKGVEGSDLDLIDGGGDIDLEAGGTAATLASSSKNRTSNKRGKSAKHKQGKR